jgi:CBS domain-containing protein
LHTGVFARHLTRHAIQLAVVLEDALNDEAKTVGQFMVRNPVCAFPWQPVSFVWEQMLANSFTYLPVQSTGPSGRDEWHLMSDFSVAKFLREGLNKSQRRSRLMSTVADAVSSGHLKLDQADQCHSNTGTDEIIDMLDTSPVLIVAEDDHSQLVGILTAFDLL